MNRQKAAVSDIQTTVRKAILTHYSRGYNCQQPLNRYPPYCWNPSLSWGGSRAPPFRNTSSTVALHLHQRFSLQITTSPLHTSPLSLLSCLFLPGLPTIGLILDRTLQEGKKDPLLPSISNGRSFLTYFIPHYFDILKLKQDRLALGPAEQHLPLIPGHCTAPAVLPHSLHSVAVLGVYWKQLWFQATHDMEGSFVEVMHRNENQRERTKQQQQQKSVNHTEWKAVENGFIFLQ